MIDLETVHSVEFTTEQGLIALAAWAVFTLVYGSIVKIKSWWYHSSLANEHLQRADDLELRLFNTEKTLDDLRRTTAMKTEHCSELTGKIEAREEEIDRLNERFEWLAMTFAPRKDKEVQ